MDLFGCLHDKRSGTKEMGLSSEAGYGRMESDNDRARWKKGITYSDIC